MVLEVMGRFAGHIALSAGIAGGADTILLPEIPFDLELIAGAIEQRQKCGLRYAVVVVAEGAFAKGSAPSFVTNTSGKKNLGGIGNIIARELSQRTNTEARATVLGHTQRGGTPSAQDRILASAFGVHAVDLAHQGLFGLIVSINGQKITSFPYSEAVGKYRPLDIKDPLIRTAEGLGINLGRAPES
jgi:6-phosphofructokinase 1